MKKTEEVFLRILKQSIGNIDDISDPDFDVEQWKQLLELAEEQEVLPLIFNEICENISFKSHTDLKKDFQNRVFRIISGQVGRNNELLSLLLHSRNEGLEPIVVKGIVCRELYKYPFLRPSIDEDLLVEDNLIEEYHRFLMKEGMYQYGQKVDYTNETELTYLRENSPLYIEIHKSPFPADSTISASFNGFFPNLKEHTKYKQIEDVQFLTLDPTYHLLFIILHAFKHFLYSGFGIRPVCDIGLYAERYAAEIDWRYIRNCLEEAKAFEFTQALFHIAGEFLFDDPGYNEFISDWNIEETDCRPLLDDLLHSGVYGANSMTRLHSSNITLAAFDNGSSGKNKNPFLSSVFLPLEKMKGKYPYLIKTPFLLPVAWIQRVFGYFMETLSNKGSNAAESIALGRKRLEIMKHYRILNGKEIEKFGLAKRIYRWSKISILASVFSLFYVLISVIEYHALNLLWTLNGARMPSEEDRSIVRDNVTFIIKSFERQHLVKGLCKNISNFYPGTSIIIADDSSEPLYINFPQVKVIQMPFNSGLGAGLEAALKEVKTPYLVRLDDDELLTVRSNVHTELRSLMNHPELDLIGFGYITAIRLRSPKYSFQEYYKNTMGDAILPLKIPHMTKIDDNHIVLGKVANIYLARTEKVRKVGFDPNIKVIDHHEFFWRAAGVIVSAIALNTIVFHRHNPYERRYQKYRSNFSTDKDYIRKKIKAMVQKAKEKKLQQNHNDC